MSDLISRKAAIEAIMKKPAWHVSEGSYYHSSDIRQALEDLPSAQPERKKGRWIYHIDDLFPSESTQECSVCHEHEHITLCHETYCPNCGTRMEEKNE